jgi:beta-glucosidase
LNFPAHPGSQARDSGQVNGPLFPFGFGLSYTSFAYANLHIVPERLPGAGRVEAGPGSATPATPSDRRIAVTCEVTNTGARAGDEIVQLYLRDDYSSVTTFEKVLRGFARVPLAPGETRTVHFTLTPEDLQLYDRDNHWTVEPGRFTVMIGASSENIRLRGHFTITRPDGTAPEEDPLPDERGDAR